MLRAIVIATAIGLAAPSYAQVIDVILDSPQLRAKNQRAMRSEHSGVEPVEQQRLSVQQSSPRRASDSWSRYQPPKSWWENYNNYEPPKSAWSSQSTVIVTSARTDRFTCANEILLRFFTARLIVCLSVAISQPVSRRRPNVDASTSSKDELADALGLQLGPKEYRQASPQRRLYLD